LIRQNNLDYGGLIAIGVVLVQPFLTAVSLDPSAKICIAAFFVAIPLRSRRSQPDLGVRTPTRCVREK
jgi:hypothetical protein